MSYASRSGRATTSPTNPRAFAVCSRCGIWVNRDTMGWQYEWRGAALANTYLLCCPRCLDVPQEQLRTIVIPPDPLPVYWPLTEPFQTDEGGNSPVYGVPVGLDQNAVMPFNDASQTAYRVNLNPLSVTSDGSTTISVTCSEPHGLATDAQIAVQGLSQAGACGFYSVTVSTATAFTYSTLNAVAAGSLLTPTTLMITALVGLPYGQTTIPQV